jgi:hypothetical protein
MPGITAPYIAGTGGSYTVMLNNVQIGTLIVSGGNVSVSIAGSMPGFMQVVRVWLESDGHAPYNDMPSPRHVLYDNGPTSGVDVAPGDYQVRATLRATPRSDIYGSAADLTLTCGGTPAATITLRVPNPNEWGLRADIYRVTSPSWPPFEGPAYTYRGTWSVGAINLLADFPSNLPTLRAPYFTHSNMPKWIAYWVGTPYTYWGVRFTGRLYVPWSDIRVALWTDEAVYVRLCNINPNNWIPSSSPNPPLVWFRIVNGTCGAPGVYDVEVGYAHTEEGFALIFMISPGTGNEMYVPTIDGAWYCSNFNWSTTRCNVQWSFRPASAGVPYFVGTNYTPSTTNDGGGTPQP